MNGYTDKEFLFQIKEKLDKRLNKVKSLIEDYSKEDRLMRTNDNEDSDLSDLVESNFDEEVSNTTIENLEKELKQIEKALKKMATGTYGFSEKSGKLIEKDRLLVNPLALTTKDEITA